MRSYILFEIQQTQTEKTENLCGLVIKAQELYKEVLLKRKDREVAEDLPWKHETIEQVIKNENYSSNRKYNNSITILSSYNNLVGQFEEGEIVSKISEKNNIGKKMIKKHLRLYGLILQKWPMGGTRETDHVLDTFYNHEQVVVIISSRYDEHINWDYGGSIVERARHIITRGWKDEWVNKKIPSHDTVEKIWKKVGIPALMKKLPPLQQILEENNLLETS